MRVVQKLTVPAVEKERLLDTAWRGKKVTPSGLRRFLQGKSSVKEALRCMAQGLRQRFSCVSRRCSAVKEMVVALQRECYGKHQLCLPLRDHMDTMGNLIHFNLMFPPG